MERFLQTIMEFAAIHGAEMIRVIDRADRETVRRGLAPKASDRLGLRFKVKPFEKPASILAYEIVQEMDPVTGQKRYRRTEKLVTYRTQNFGLFEATRSITIPRAYVLPGEQREVIKKLLTHGIMVEELKEPVTVEAEVYVVEDIKLADRPFQGHRETSLQGTFERRRVQLPAGSFYVTMGQPKAALVFYLLEPESDDGLVDWNFFDEYLVPRRDASERPVFPVYRLHESLNVAKWVVSQFGL